MANYSTLKAAVEAVVKTNGEQAITGANMQTVLLSIINSIGGGGYIFEGVATPSTNAGTPDQNVFYLAGAGTYANFGTSVVVPPTNIAVFKYNGSWTCEQVMVENGGVFDISAFKAVGGTLATYADLAAALGTGGANVPEGIRKGGMSIKFVQSSDNRYVQYRLMSDSYNTTVANWQGVDEEPKDYSKNLVGSGGVANIVYDNRADINTLQKDTVSVIEKTASDFNVTGFLGIGGGVATGGSYDLSSCTDFIDITNVKKIEVCALFGNSYGAGLGFYNESQTVILPTIYHLNSIYGDNTKTVLRKEDIPTGAKYIRVCRLTAGVTPAYIKLYTVTGSTGKVPTLEGKVSTLESKMTAVEEILPNKASVSDVSQLADRIDDILEISETIITEVSNSDFDTTGFIWNDGHTSSESNYKYTDYIEINVTDYTNIIAKVLWHNPYGGKVAYYDENKTFIRLDNSWGGTTDNTNEEHTIPRSSIPDNAKYIRATKAAIWGAGEAFVKVVENVETGELAELSQRVDVLEDSIDTYKFDMYNYLGYAQIAKIYVNKGYNASGVMVDSTGHRASEIVPIIPDKNIYFGENSSTGGVENCYAYFYDGNKEFMSKVSPKWSKFEIPSGAKYVSFDLDTTQISSYFPVVTFRLLGTLWDFTPQLVPMKDVRNIVKIHTSDTELEILQKMLDALAAGDCDVYFDFGTYNFTSTIFDKINDLGLEGRGEVPLGRNCHYYLNGATVSGVYDGSRSIAVATFGTWANSSLGSFVIEGGAVKAGSKVFCAIHMDQGIGNLTTKENTILIKNLQATYDDSENVPELSETIGIGMISTTRVYIENCVIINNASGHHPVVMHGQSNNSNVINTRLELHGNYMNGELGLAALGVNETCDLVLEGNAWTANPTIPSGENYVLKMWGNTILT